MTSQHAATSSRIENASGHPDYFAVSAETGYPVHEVRSRGVTYCRAKLRARGDEFDQTFPETFEAEVVEAKASEALRIIDEVRTARVPLVTMPILEAGTPIFTVREPVKGGVAIVGCIGRRDIFVTAALSDDEVQVREPAYREALHAFMVAAPQLIEAA